MVGIRLLRDRSQDQRVTNIELFFDLVYVFAVTQLSHHLLGTPTVGGALQTLLLLAMVWLVWAYTTWVTNWIDPERMAVRLLLVVLMLISLAMSAALPRAFTDLGLMVGGAYAVMQVGRSAFMVVVLRGEPLRANFERILAWCVVSGAFALTGGLVHGHPRWVLWLLAVCVDLLGGAVGFAAPGLGRSRTADWTIEGGHFAERCQAFILIALGESIVTIGTGLSEKPSVTAGNVTAFVVAFAGAVTLWWLYFDRSAAAGASIIAASDDPGRLGRSAYHLIHPVMVAGIIVCAAADSEVLTHPGEAAGTATAWMILGGPALFLAGHAAFKRVVWGYLPRPRVAGIVALALLAPAAGAIPRLALATCAAVVVLAVTITDYIPRLSGHPSATSVPSDSMVEALPAWYRPMIARAVATSLARTPDGPSTSMRSPKPARRWTAAAGRPGRADRQRPGPGGPRRREPRAALPSRAATPSPRRRCAAGRRRSQPTTVPRTRPGRSPPDDRPAGGAAGQSRRARPGRPTDPHARRPRRDTRSRPCSPAREAPPPAAAGLAGR